MTHHIAGLPSSPLVPRRNESARRELILRVRGEFIEMPGLKLTPEQAQRLWGLDRGIVGRVLGTLVRDGFLVLSPDGAYKRADVVRSE
jgi:hypothetical protein